MGKFYNKNLSTIYVPLTEVIDKETYLKVLDLVISIKETNKINKELKDKRKQKVVVLIDVFKYPINEDYSQEVFSLLSTIRDQLYTVITGGAGKYATLIFLLASKSRRYMLPGTHLCVWNSYDNILKHDWHDTEFKNLQVNKGEDQIAVHLPCDKDKAKDLFSVKFAKSIDEIF